MTLVEDEVSFSLSFDDEDFDAEATDKMYEKIKDGEKRKTKNSMKSSKTKKKKDMINDLPDIETGESVEKEVGEELKKEENITPEAKENTGTNMESPTFRSKSTVYNTSQLTGW